MVMVEIAVVEKRIYIRSSGGHYEEHKEMSSPISLMQKMYWNAEDGDNDNTNLIMVS